MLATLLQWEKTRRALGASALCLAAVAASAAHAACGPEGNPHLPRGLFADAGRGMVYHVPSRTVWKRCAEGQIWSASTCVGTALLFSASGAADRLNATNASAPGTQNGGQTSWQIPGLNEMRLLKEKGCSMSVINLAEFPGAPPIKFWTATPYFTQAEQYWTMDFGVGEPIALPRTHAAALRLMRPATAQELKAVAAQLPGDDLEKGIVLAQKTRPPTQLQKDWALATPPTPHSLATCE